MQQRLASYLAVLAGDGHQVAAETAELRSGQFHDVVLAGDVAFRFPRDEESRRALPGRLALLAALGGCDLPAAIPVPIPVPDRLRRDQMDRPVGSCYVALNRVPGAPFEAAMLDAALAADALVAQLAELLAELARLGAAPAIRQAAPTAGAGDWQDWAGRVRAVLFPLMSQGGRRRAEAELAAVLTVPAGGDALVHTDLGGANLLLTVPHACGPGTSGTGAVPRLAGILDWDGACIGNQANDLASLAVTFGWPLAARIDRRRRGSGGSLIRSARLVAATFALQQALPAALSGDPVSLDDGLSQYR